VIVPTGSAGGPTPYLTMSDLPSGYAHALDIAPVGSIDDAAVAPVTNVVAYVKRLQSATATTPASPRGIAAINPDASALRWLVPPRAGIDIAHVAWSADGSRLLWQQQRSGSATTYLWTLDVMTPAAKPAVVPGSGDIRDATFATTDSGTILGVTATGGRLVTLRGGATATVGSVSGADAARFVPGDTTIVYTVDGTIFTIPSDGSSDPVTIAGDHDYQIGDVASDGTAVYATGAGEDPGAVYRVPLQAGSTGTAVFAAGIFAHNAYAAPSVVDVDTTPMRTAPGHFVVHLSGDVVTLTWPLPQDIDFSHVEIRRTNRFAEGAGVLVYAGRGTSFTETLPSGAYVTYALYGFDGSGNRSGGAEIDLQPISVPAVSAPLLASSAATTPNFPVSWTESGVSDPQFVTAWAPGGGTYQPWLGSAASPTSDMAATFGAGGQPTTPVPGRTYYVQVRSATLDDNVSAPATVHVTEPFDDRAASAKGGWHDWTRTDAWLDTWRGTRTAGAALWLRMTGRRFHVIGDRLPQGGRFAVYLDGAKVATVDTYAPTLRTRQVLWSSGLMARATRTLMVVNLATAGRPQLDVDGLAATP
jgi:hypothetical protein